MKVFLKNKEVRLYKKVKLVNASGIMEGETDSSDEWFENR